MTSLIDCFTPTEIEERSFSIIGSELGLGPESPGPTRLACELFPRTGGRLPFAGDAWQVARRLVHASADYSLLPHLHIPAGAVRAGVAALRGGAPVYTDTEMARAGMPLRRLAPLGVTPACLLSLPGVTEYAREKNMTRARAAFERAAAEGRLGGSILAVGNAPTALLALLDFFAGLDRAAGEGSPASLPALVIAMPVGFVNAAESKELLLARPGLPCIAIRGRRGGSPLAAATVNALAELALRPAP
jgi:precorrin-8X/cobalt-precorrin-8 methylmutase